MVLIYQSKFWTLWGGNHRSLTGGVRNNQEAKFGFGVGDCVPNYFM